MSNPLLQVITANRAGVSAALASICSAQPDVILASALLAAEKGAPLLVEATSNQVNQDAATQACSQPILSATSNAFAPKQDCRKTLLSSAATTSARRRGVSCPPIKPWLKPES